MITTMCMICMITLHKFESRLFDAFVLRDSENRPLVTLSIKEDEKSSVHAQWMEYTDSGYLVMRFANLRTGDATLKLIDVASKKTLASAMIKGGGGPENDRPNCAISGGKGWIAYGDGQNLRFLALPTCLHELPGRGLIELEPRAVKDSAYVWSEETGEKVLVYRPNFVRPELTRWDLKKQSKEKLADIPSEHLAQTAVALQPHKRRMAVAGSSKGEFFIESWTLGNKPKKVVIDIKIRVTSLAYSADGTSLAAGYGDGTVVCYDPDNGKAKTPVLKAGKFMVRSIAFHPLANVLACGTLDRGVPNLIFFDITLQKTIVELAADNDGVTYLSFSANGDNLAAFGGSGTVSIWSASNLLKLVRD